MLHLKPEFNATHMFHPTSKPLLQFDVLVENVEVRPRTSADENGSISHNRDLLADVGFN